MSGGGVAKVYDARFKVPASFFVAGASGSGKSYFARKLVENRDLLFDRPFDKVIWVYNHYQDMFTEPSLKDVHFVQGLPFEDFEKQDGQRLLIIDDHMEAMAECKEFTKFITQNRHISVSVLFLTQSLFFKSPVYRCASLNANYFILMRMLRDKKQILTLVHQMFSDNPKYAKEAILGATKEPYSYVVLDTRQTTPDELRIRTKIFPEDWTAGFYAQIVYLPTHRSY